MRTLGLAAIAALALLVLWIGGAQVSLPGSTQSAPAAPTAPVLIAPAVVQTPITLLPGVPPRKPHHPARQSPKMVKHAPVVTPVTVVIARLGVRAPVRERGVDPTGHLPIATGYVLTHFSFSAGLGELGNYVLYGHDDIEGNILRYLPTMRAGDRVDLYQGALHVVYVVTGSAIVPPSDVSVLNPTPDATLTLISCTPFDVDTGRIVVKARLLRVEDQRQFQS